MPLLQVSPERVLEIPVTLFSNSTVELTLQNVSTQPFVAYKIKTTAPKSYLVRPSTGVVPQGEVRSVQIVLQALSEEPPTNSTDRFLVQATPVDSNCTLPRHYWLSLEKAKVEETRLSVSFKRVNGQLSTGHTGSLPGEGSASGGGRGAEGAGSTAAPTSATAGGSGSNATSAADLKQQYDQLVEYTLAMEKHKEELTRENEALKQQLECRGGRSLAELWHLPIYLFVLFMLWYILDRTFGGGGASSKP
ncbi:vesicle-associated protein 2-1 [Cyclospora cayetanensis]|uniref:Major sperm protein domain-containing protein n=2 Tax=Cyclospora cayetanensis TaxID=88456 RepID=A0A1D3CW52_9EIME|nr:vesicle-associated protein 2-1 [Cyclospora cayetanensis]OEH75411.1 major sperm protein domain-containing protein [Cyclospora cayetanensis]